MGPGPGPTKSQELGAGPETDPDLCQGHLQDRVGYMSCAAWCPTRLAKDAAKAGSDDDDDDDDIDSDLDDGSSAGGALFGQEVPYTKQIQWVRCTYIA